MLTSFWPIKYHFRFVCPQTRPNTRTFLHQLPLYESLSNTRETFKSFLFIYQKSNHKKKHWIPEISWHRRKSYCYYLDPRYIKSPCTYYWLPLFQIVRLSAGSGSRKGLAISLHAKGGDILHFLPSWSRWSNLSDYWPFLLDLLIFHWAIYNK